MPYGARSIGYTNSGGNSSLYGESPSTGWNNTVFRARIKPLTDLSDRRVKSVVREPENDLLDDFKVGQLVRGISKKNKQVYQGKITRIIRNSKGDGVRLYIQEDGEEKEIEVLPSSLVYVKKQDQYAKDIEDAGINRGMRDERNTNRSGTNQLTIPVEENKKLTHLLEFNEFCDDIYKK